MPGYLHHLACANEVAKQLKGVPLSNYGDIKLDTEKFVLASLIPDLAKDKQGAHYQSDEHVRNGWRYPNLAKMEKLDDASVYLGIWCHLYLDYWFVMDFLSKKFEIRKKFGFKMVYDQWDSGRRWRLKDFLSPMGIYASYSASNRRLIAEGLLPEWLIQPIGGGEYGVAHRQPPRTGLRLYDEHGKHEWFDEVEYYLSESRPTNDNPIISYDDLRAAILVAANMFVGFLRF